MVNPINYTLGGPDPVGQLMQGIQFGTGLRQAGLQEDAQRQQMELAAAQEARTAEMQPIRMEEAQLGLDAARQGLQQGQLSIEQQRQQLAAADRELARQEAFQSSMTRLAELGPNATFEDYQKVGASFPEFAGAVQESWTGLDSNRQAGVQRRLLQIGAALKGGATDTAVHIA